MPAERELLGHRDKIAEIASKSADGGLELRSLLNLK
jgi:hypothetical protein